MSISVSTFQADVTPPLGTPLCHGNCPPGIRVSDPLTARGIVLFTDEKPIVLCAVDWVCISNKSHDLWREKLAEAAGTDVSRVVVHTLHPHDAPGTDMSAQELLNERGMENVLYNMNAEDDAVSKTADTLRLSLSAKRNISQLAIGKSKVKKFAANRRILGPDGNVRFVRFSSCANEEVRNQSEGLIDPFVRLLCLYDNDDPVASLTYYATHPQSFYRRGAISADTVGLARYLREASVPTAAHIHFCGAGGNIAAGKYNDGSPENRFKLARRLAKGMEDAWGNAVRIPIDSKDVSWQVASVSLPLNQEAPCDNQELEKILDDPNAELRDRIFAARKLSFNNRMGSREKIDIPCLKLGPVSVLHMPGELFIEYQIAAQEMCPDSVVCMAAYGDAGPGYIGTDIAYSQGGYETNPHCSRVAPGVEKVLMDAMREVLEK